MSGSGQSVSSLAKAIRSHRSYFGLLERIYACCTSLLKVVSDALDATFPFDILLASADQILSKTLPRGDIASGHIAQTLRLRHRSDKLTAGCTGSYSSGLRNILEKLSDTAAFVK